MTPIPDPMVQLAYAFAPLTGVLEQGLAAHPGGAQARAVWLLSHVVTGLSRQGAAVSLPDLTLTQFDGILAAFYRMHYADALPAQAKCGDCAEPFEINFNLSDVQAQLVQGSAPYEGDHMGSLIAPSGRVFRLPRVADLERLTSTSPEEWLRDLLQDGPFDLDDFQEELECAGPVLSQTINAACPACNQPNTIRFDLADFVTATFAGEAAFLWREVHLLARSYGWSLAEVLSLPRDVRRRLAGLVVADAPKLRRAS